MNYSKQLNLYKDKKIFVTGVAGFIGANLTKKLLDLGAYIIGADDLSAENTSILYDFAEHRNFVFIKDDFASVDIPKDIDYIFHLAVRNISVSEITPESSYAVNVIGSKRLVSKARDLNDLKRFMFFSTSSIYGTPCRIPTREEDLDPKNLFCNYAQHKYAIEQDLRNSKIPYTIVRPTNVYGPRQTNENPYCGILGKWIFNILNGYPIEIIGDGTQTRDFIYIDDIIEACLLLAHCPSAIGNIYNIGVGKEISINSLAEAINNVASEYNFHVETKKTVPRAIDCVKRRCLNIDKIKNETGWQPRVGLEKGLNFTFTWAFNFCYKKKFDFKKIGISVPAYNEENFIADTLTKIPAWVDFITVVNDCSLDNTSQVARNVKDDRIVVIDHKKNDGVGGAILTAHKENIKRGADILAVIAGDGQMDPKYLTDILKPICFESYDYTKGNRFRHIEELKTMPKVRLIGNIILTVLAKLTAGYWNVGDPLNGYTAITKDIFCKLNLEHLSKAHDFELSLLMELSIHKARVKDVFIPARYGQEKSKIVLKKMIPLTLSNLLKNFIRRIFVKYIYNTIKHDT